MTDRPKARTFDEAIKVSALTPEEEAKLEGRKEQAADRGFESVEDMDDHDEEERRKAAEKGPSPLEAKAADPGEEQGIPRWVVVPEALKFPLGRQVGFLRFPSEWTTRRDVGLPVEAGEPKGSPYKSGSLHRQCILWSLSIADEKLARRAAGSDNLGVYEEMAKRCIRAIDGRVPDRDKGDAGEVSVKRFWEDIGPACRQAVVNFYHRTHTLTGDQLQGFLLFGLAVRSSVTG